MATSSKILLCESHQKDITMEGELVSCSQQLNKIQLKSDEEIARKLQLEYDKEYNTLKYLEEFKDSSFTRTDTSDSRENTLNTDSAEELEDTEDSEWDIYDTVLEGYKHKSESQWKLHSKSHAKNPGEPLNRLSQHFKCKRPNKNISFNKARSHITVSYPINDSLTIILCRLISQGLIEEVDDVVYIGNNAVTLHAKTNPESQLPSECAIMMFTAAFSDLNNPGRRVTQQSMHYLAKKEMHNLTKLKEAGVLCPTIFCLNGSALVMSYLGRNNKLSPKLKHVSLSETKFTVAYSQIVQYLHVMYSKCNLVHGKLSEQSILWFDNNCYILDVSQSVEAHHENAFPLLHKDCVKISKFFEKQDIPGVASPDQLFNDITGLNYEDIVTERKTNSNRKSHNISNPDIGRTKFEDVSEG